LPKTVVIPADLKSSNAASRTVVKVLLQP
jgi:hypothetical protein